MVSIVSHRVSRLCCRVSRQSRRVIVWVRVLLAVKLLGCCIKGIFYFF